MNVEQAAKVKQELEAEFNASIHDYIGEKWSPELMHKIEARFKKRVLAYNELLDEEDKFTIKGDIISPETWKAVLALPGDSIISSATIDITFLNLRPRPFRFRRLLNFFRALFTQIRNGKL